MELLLESLTAFFAAVGIAWLVWAAAQRLFFEKRQTLEKCIAVVPVSGDAPALEGTVSGLAHVSICGQQLYKIMIADCGLTEESLALAQKLAQRYEQVALCSAEEAQEEKN